MFYAKIRRSVQHFFSDVQRVAFHPVPFFSIILMAGFLVHATGVRAETENSNGSTLDDQIAIEGTSGSFGPCYGQADVYFNLEIAGLYICFASNSITTIDPAKVESTGKLWLIAPTVVLDPGFYVDSGGMLSVISVDYTDHFPESSL